MHIAALRPEDVLACHDGIVDAYTEVFTEPPWSEDEADVDDFAGVLSTYASWPGFRGAVLTDAAGVVQGFTLGTDWTHESGWCAQVERDLGPRAERWTSDCFHLIELAVRPARRGQGHGAALYDAVVAGLPHRTAILSTNQLGPAPAATLYARRGWKLLIENWRHCCDCAPVQVLGLTDPALSARTLLPSETRR